jgi:hypothetical protein
MIEAQTADGAIHQFPDGTPDAAIDKAIGDYTTQASARKANSGASGYVDSLVRSVAQGATFGFGDELSAGADAALGPFLGRGSQASTIGQRYDENLAAERARDRAFQTDNPVSSTVGNVAGGVGGALALPATQVAKAAAPLLSRINPIVQGLPGWVRTGASYIGGGAAAGGVAGFGEGEGGLDERLRSGAAGAVAGGITAPVLGGVVNAVTPAAGRALNGLGLRDPAVAADRQILRAIDRGGQTVDDVATRLNAAGDAPVALVDIGNRNLVNLGATAANTPSRALDVADRFVENRRIGRPDRLMTTGDDVFGGGSGTDVADATRDLRSQRSTEAAPLYEEAFSRPAGMIEPMKAILSDPVAQTGLKRGLEIQRIENATRRARGEAEVPTTDPAIHYDDAGDPKIVGVPNMRSLDAVKRGMDAVIDDARDSTTGKVQWTERLRAIDDMRRTWVNMLDENNPSYAAARAAWGGPSAQMEATQAGQQALRANRDVVAQRAAQGPPDVQDAYRLGAGRAFSDRVSDPARASGAARQMLEDGQMQSRLGSILGPTGLERLNAGLRQEVDMTAVERSVSPRAGSQTARLLAGGSDMGKDVAGPWLTAARQVLSGHPVEGAFTVGGDLYRRIGQGINASTADEMANRLFTTDPQARAEVVAALRNRLLGDEQSTAQARAVIRPVVRGVARSAGGRAGQP